MLLLFTSGVLLEQFASLPLAEKPPERSRRWTSQPSARVSGLSRLVCVSETDRETKIDG